MGDLTGPISPLGGGATTGVQTNSNASPGAVGEIITATLVVGSAVALTTATPANVTSIALTAGDWDVSGQIDFNLTGTTVTDMRGGPSLTSATLPTQPGGAGLGTDPLAIDPSNFATITDVQTLDSGPVRLSIAATTTVFLVASATFSVGTVGAFGTIRARRMR
jgi:hypothetical protein